MKKQHETCYICGNKRDGHTHRLGEPVSKPCNFPVSEAEQGDKAIARLIELARRHHYNCEEDTFYGCPKSDCGCSDPRYGKECNCGADEHNAEVERLAAIVREFRK